jgi:hypothetical protein
MWKALSEIRDGDVYIFFGVLKGERATGEKLPFEKVYRNHSHYKFHRVQNYSPLPFRYLLRTDVRPALRFDMMDFLILRR